MKLFPPLSLFPSPFPSVFRKQALHKVNLQLTIPSTHTVPPVAVPIAAAEQCSITGLDTLSPFKRFSCFVRRTLLFWLDSYPALFPGLGPIPGGQVPAMVFANFLRPGR